VVLRVVLMQMPILIPMPYKAKKRIGGRNVAIYRGPNSRITDYLVYER